MAEMPIERNSGIPAWGWLILGALVIAFLIWTFIGIDNDRAIVATDVDKVVVTPLTDAAPMAAPTAAATGPITDLASITGASSLTPMVGREVQLTHVRVLEVAGDRTFWVGPNADQRALIVVNEQATSGQPRVERRYDVTTGQVINVNGMVRNIDHPAFVGKPIEGLPAGQTAVIQAQSLNIVQRP